METDYKNRMQTATKQRGRPKAGDAEPAVLLTPMPPHLCPHCRRGQTPRTKGTGSGGVRYVDCALCGKAYSWSPPTVRVTA